MACRTLYIGQKIWESTHLKNVISTQKNLNVNIYILSDRSIHARGRGKNLFYLISYLNQHNRYFL